MNSHSPHSLVSPARTSLAALVLAMAGPALAQNFRVIPITVPGATGISVSALNQAGQVAGDYHAGGSRPRAFLWSAGSAVDLGTLGGSSSRVLGLNNLGDVTGQSSTAGDGESRAFLYTAGVMLDLGMPGASPSAGRVINDIQQVAGSSQLGPGSPEARAFIAGLGMPAMDLGTLGGRSSTATAINLMGQVVGSSSTWGDAATHAFVSMGGMLLDLGTLGGTSSHATAINLFGQLTGAAAKAGDAEVHAFMLDSFTFAGMVDMGTLGGRFSEGRAINQAGQIIGDSTTAGEAETRAFLHTGGVMVDLGTLGGGYSSACGLNNAGQVVGVSRIAGGQERAFLWQNGSMRDLNTLVPAGSGWELHSACFINDAGQIAGFGTRQGQPAWFMLSPGLGENQPPVASAGADQDLACSTAALVTLDASGSSDPDGDALTFEWSAGGVVLGAAAVLQVSLPPGHHALTVRVSDARGASAEDSMTVSVGDRLAPVLACPPGQSAEPNQDGNAAVPDFLQSLVVSDNCASAAALLRAQNPPAGTLVGGGTHAVILTVTDAAGNAGSCAVSFVVGDTTPPRVRCPESLTRRANANGVAVVPDLRGCVSDHGTPADALVVVQTPAPGSPAGPGEHAIVVTATDAAGNRGSCTSLLKVVDRTAPVVRSLTASPGSLVDGGGMVPVTLTMRATDNCDANPVSRIVSVAGHHRGTGRAGVTSPDWNITGDLTLELRAERTGPGRSRVYAVKVSCTDASGNSSMRTVHVVVKKAP